MGSLRAKKLSRKDIRCLGDGLHSDGGNLYLRVRGNGRSWVFRYKLKGKTHELGLGSVELISLADARKKALEMRVGLANGQIPTQKRRLLAISASRAEVKNICLNDIVEKALKNRVDTGKAIASEYIKKRMHVYDLHLRSSFGKIPINNLTRMDVADVVNKSTLKNPKNLLGIIKIALQYAKDVGLLEGDVPLPSGLIRKAGDPNHIASIHWKDVPQAYAKVMAYPDTYVKKFLLAVMLCVNRPIELTFLQPSGVNIEAQTFTLERTKTSKVPVTFPIPRQILHLFKPPYHNKYVFGRRDKALARTTPLNLLKEILGDDTVTLHGFRSSFSTWCADNGKDYEIRERCLTHKVDNAVAASYQRSDLLERRRQLLQEWADYVTSSCDP